MRRKKNSLSLYINPPVYSVDVSTWPVTPATIAQKAPLDRVEAKAMAWGEGADIVKEEFGGVSRGGGCWPAGSGSHSHSAALP